MLRDAEEKQELSHEAQVWIQELKAAVYDADDLVDEFVSIAEQKQHMDGTEASKRCASCFLVSILLPLVTICLEGSRRLGRS